MAEVSIDKVKPGSVLAKDVMQGDALLMACGTALTGRQIEFLEQRGVETVSIEGGPAGAPTDVSELVYFERCRKLDRMFESASQASHMDAIREEARERLRSKRPWE